LVISRVQGLLLPAISLVLLCGVSGYQKSNRFTTGVFVLGACLCILIFLFFAGSVLTHIPITSPPH